MLRVTEVNDAGLSNVILELDASEDDSVVRGQ